MNHPPVIEDDVLQGEFPDPEDVFLIEWGRETLKQSIPRLSESLGRVVTLATALCGGSLYLSSPDVVPLWFRAGSAVLFLVALAGAFYGSLARSDTVRLGDPADVRRFKSEAAEFKGWWLRFSSLFLFVGLFVASLGALLKAAHLA